MALHPSSPIGAEPLSAEADEAVFEAGYDAASYAWAYSDAKSLDPVALFISCKDARIPAGMNESHPQFWEYLGVFTEAVVAFAQSHGMAVAR